MAIMSLLMIIGFVIGLAATRYFSHQKRRQNGPKNSPYSLASYGRRQFPSISFDSFLPSPPAHESRQPNTDVNETSRIIKNSFSWPEAALLHHHQQQPNEKDECSSTMSNSSTIEHIFQPALLTFAVRWDEKLGSLYVRVVSARDLLVYRRNRQPTLIDSYVRVQLLSTEPEQSPGRCLYRFPLS